jgi:hypothetical protein
MAIKRRRVIIKVWVNTGEEDGWKEVLRVLESGYHGDLEIDQLKTVCI